MKGFIVGCLLLAAFVIFVVIKPLEQEATASKNTFRQAKADFHRSYPRITIADIEEKWSGGYLVVYHPLGAYDALCKAPILKINGAWRIDTAELRPPCSRLTNRKA